MKRSLLLALLAVLVLGALAPFAVRPLLWHWEQNPLLRGRLAAERLGCSGCHLHYGNREIPNPGSRWGSIPRFQAGNAMMYAGGREEIGEILRFGAPRAWLDDETARARLEVQRIRMPAYEDRLSESELADLVAFTCAQEGVELPGGEAAAAGRALAREHGCTACHGIEGAGGLPNPGSLGGFIPGFAGENFPDLVNGEDEFAEWVRTGTSRRLEGNPLVRHFWERQEISMPAYGDALSDEDLAALWAWVQAVREAYAEAG